MKPSDTLADMQQAFASALFDSGCESQALPMFKGEASLAQQRFALYRGNLTAGWEKSLASAYPVIQALVGEEFFAGLAREYGKAHPSLDGDINRFGDRFADFLRGFKHVAEYPYFPDVAALEWALHRAYYADDAVALAAAQFGERDAEEVDRSVLTLHPACALVASGWSVIDIWRAHQPEGGDWPPSIDEPSWGVVVRPHWQAEVLKLSHAAWRMLDELRQGTPFGAAIDVALEADPGFDLAAILKQCLEHGIFVSMEGQACKD